MQRNDGTASVAEEKLHAEIGENVKKNGGAGAARGIRR
jgi:hypothetical protein